MSAITTTVNNGAGIITINRPKAYNALNVEVLNGIGEALTAWEDDAAVQSVILIGEGDKAFAAGADLTELSTLDPLEVLHSYPMAGLYNRLEAYPKPTIAAVNGLALGGGFELALACDIRVASPNAKFSFPELGLGIIPGAGGTQRLREVAGRSVALHMILTKEMIPAERAYQLGIVTVLDDEPLTAALTLTEALATNGPTAQRFAREAIKEASGGSGHSGHHGHHLEQLSQAVAFSHPESREGMNAFLERRKPHFTNPSA